MEKHSFTNTRGAALPEVIIAILILVSGSIASLTLMDTILKLAVSSNDRIIATNLARDGLEAVRSVRDSNWLRFSGSQRDTSATTRDHWNDGFDYDTGVSPLILHYRILLARVNGDLQWMIDSYDAAQQTDDPAVITSGTYYQIFTESSTIDPIGTTKTLYNYELVGETATPFYRQVKITYLDSHDGDSDADIQDNLVLVESKVYWKEKSGINVVELDTILSDWYGRGDHLT